ncbi:MAG TPA: antibiotic biosynthesis monooxygenase [Terriglobia bacterium]|nr:antibiotic biosynthesis monooxygenase [Terriglobia bacterium]
MFVLHVDLEVRSDSRKALESTYEGVFRPAISSQPGFDHILLLQSDKFPNVYRLVIAFQDEPSQKKWVASDLHQEVWPRMESSCSSYKVETFHTLKE